MKLTTKQLKQIIKEELIKISESRYFKKGNLTLDTNADRHRRQAKIDPEMMASLDELAASGDEGVRQAYEFARSLGSKEKQPNDWSVPDIGAFYDDLEGDYDDDSEGDYDDYSEEDT